MITHVVNDPEKIGQARWGNRYRRYRQLWKKAEKGEYLGTVPPFLILDTIDACNLSCVICHQRGRKRTGARIGVDRVKDLVAEAADQGVYSANLSAMAEPYMAPDILLDLAEHFKSLEVMDVMMHTNFQLPDEKLILDTIEAGVTHFCVSVDATCAETYKRIRGGNFEKLMHNMRFLSRHKKETNTDYPIIRVSAVPVKENRVDIRDFVAYWGEYADVIEVQGYRSDEKHKSEGTFLSKPKTSCFQPWTRLMLWPTGEVTFCSSKEVYFSKEAILGNFYEEPKRLADYWQGEKINRIRSAFLARELDRVPSCKSCQERSYVPDGGF